MNNIAIIPARGGSKGIPGKNLKKIGGSSLLKLAIDSATTSLITDIIVSTDSPNIASEAERYGATVMGLRKDHLSTDTTKTLDVVIDTISIYEKTYKEIDNIVLLEPTSPFRNRDHVEEALKKYLDNNYGSLVSITNLERKPENIFIKNETLSKYIKEPNEKFEQRQQMEHLCRINSAIYCANKHKILEKRELLTEPVGWFFMAEEASLNIDTKLDLELARLIESRLKTN